MTVNQNADLQIDDRCAIFTLDRPERGNALSIQLVDRLSNALQHACADPDVDTFALRGAGKHFCTGFDLSGLESETDASLLERFVRIELLLDALWRAPIRTVAIGHGKITGAGADLFVACDHRLMGRDAEIRFPGVRFGLVLGTGRLAERVGTDRAFAWTSEGATVDSTMAVSSRLATALLDADVDFGATAAWTAIGRICVDAETLSSLRKATRDATSDRDLAALVRSAARPGLKARIAAYRGR